MLPTKLFLKLTWNITVYQKLRSYQNNGELDDLKLISRLAAYGMLIGQI